MAAPRGRKVLNAKFCLFSFDTTHHPLHLGIHKSCKASVVGNQVESDFVVAIWRRNERVLHAGSSRLLISVTVLDHVDFGTDVNKVIQTPKSEQIMLLCTHTFLKHYGINENETVLLKLAGVCPLKSVTFGAKSDLSKHWAEQQLFSTGLLLSLCQKPILVRDGDVLLAPYTSLYDGQKNFSMQTMFDLTTLSCEPVAQGILSVNTEVTVVRLDKDSFPEHEQNSQQKSNVIDTPYSPSIPSIVSDFANCLSTHSFAASVSQITNFSGPHTVFKISCPTENMFPLLETALDCVIIEEQDLLFQSLMLICQNKTLDNKNTVGLSSSTMKQLGLFDGSLVKLRCRSKRETAQNSVTPTLEDSRPTCSNSSITEGKPAIVERIAQVTQIYDVVVNVAYMLPVLWFNLSGDVSHRKPLQVTIQKSLGGTFTNSEDDEDVLISRTSSSTSWSEKLPYATEVHVALVHSPQYSAGVPIDTLLQKYFSSPRILREGDIIALLSEDDPNFAAADSSDAGDSCPVIIYFKVKQVICERTPGGSTCLVDTSHTSLFQDGCIHSYVPINMMKLLCPALSPIASGLDDHVVSLQSLLQPHIQPKGVLDLLPVVLLSGAAGCGKTRVVAMVAEAFSLHLLDVNCHELCGETSASTEAKIKATLIRARSCAPCILLLRNIHTLAKDRDGHTEDMRVAQSFNELVSKHIGDNLLWPVIVVATTSSPKSISSALHKSFLHHVKIEVPDEATRQAMLSSLLQSKDVLPDIDVKHIAQRTAGFVLGDLEALVHHAQRNAITRVAKHWFGDRWQHLSVVEEEDVWIAGVYLGQIDLLAALDQLQAAHSDAIGAPKIPSVQWADVGGLADVKADILDTIQLPLEHPELFAAGLRRSGVLLYGPPGTGKTLLAKAVATECSLNFLSVKGPELINMYVGQSEENVREVFERARSAVPCVIFFDELDSLAPNRGRSGDSGGVMDRVVSQLLAELDGLHKSCDVFVIGATNRPDLLDPALLRPGRFDKLLYLGVSEDKPSQLKILQALTRKFSLSPSCHLDRIAERCPMNLTGADFYALCSDAMLNSIKRKIDLLESGATSEDQNSLVVEEGDFLSALETLVPSVSEAELAQYKTLQNFLYKQKS